jgi:hypothetical protein
MVNKMRKVRFRKGAWVLIPLFILGIISPISAEGETPPGESTTTIVESTTTTIPDESTTTTVAEETTTTSSSSSSTTTTVLENTGPIPIPNAGFEDNTFDGWSRGTQSGSLGASISGNGTGVTIFEGSKAFNHPPHPAIGDEIKNGQPNPYYAPAVSAGSWIFSPNDATYAVALQPKGEQNFSQAMSALGLLSSDVSAIQSQLVADAQSAANGGSSNPTDAAWITREVELEAGVIYTMSWNYLGTDYVPFNDGSITSLVAVSTPPNPVVTVNNFERRYALLGFTNPGTGDYSVNSYGATGWQISTYEVSVSGTYKLGFAAFNLGDQALSPVLMVDNVMGETDRCVPAGSNCIEFGGVAPNNETAPSVATTTTSTTSTTTTTTTSTTVVDTTVPSVTTTSPPAPSPQPQTPPATQPSVQPQPVESTVPEEIPTTLPPLETTTTSPQTLPIKTTTTTTTKPNNTTTTVVTSTTIEIIDIEEVEPKVVDTEVPEIQNKNKEVLNTEEVLKIINEDLNNLSIEDIQEIFSSINIEDLSTEEIDQIVETLNKAEDEIKESFEKEVNVYAGGFDDYIPAGSAIDVGSRKTVIAAAALLATITVTSAIPPTKPSGGGAPGGSSGGSPSGSPEGRSRREEDLGDESNGEIAGPEEDEDGNYAKNSIFKYYIKDGIEMKKFNWFGFSKKLWDITAGLAFTLAGSFVVYITLSGTTQRLAGIATLIALFVHYLHEILKNDID